jgi:two-component system sensor kinase FixL
MSMSSEMYSNEFLLRLAIDGVSSGLAIIDEQSRVAIANRSFLRMFGFEAGEIVGQSIDRLFTLPVGILQGTTCESRRTEELDRSTATEQRSVGWRKDGTEFPISISLNAIESEHGTFVMANVVEATNFLASDSGQANQAAMERLMIVGQLAGGVAHEIRTPLSVMRNDVYFLQSLGDRLGPEATEAIQEISDALARANRIVAELLDFTRAPVNRPGTVKLSCILAAALKSYRLPSTVTLRTAESIEQCLVQADSEQVERILINLLRNAVQAMHEKGTIELECGGDSGTVWLDVIDDGPGIKESDRQRIFDPLFTTKLTGIGLGLAISLRYAKSNQGDLTVQSRSHGGACFRLTLPRGLPLRASHGHE